METLVLVSMSVGVLAATAILVCFVVMLVKMIIEGW